MQGITAIFGSGVIMMYFSYVRSDLSPNVCLKINQVNGVTLNIFRGNSYRLLEITTSSKNKLWWTFRRIFSVAWGLHCKTYEQDFQRYVLLDQKLDNCVQVKNIYISLALLRALLTAASAISARSLASSSSWASLRNLDMAALADSVASSDDFL